MRIPNSPNPSVFARDPCSDNGFPNRRPNPLAQVSGRVCNGCTDRRDARYIQLKTKGFIGSSLFRNIAFPFFELMKLNRFKIESQICCMRASANTQASFAFAAAVNAAAFFRTNSCTLSGRCPVSVSTSSDSRSKRPARCRSPIAARWFTR